MSSGTVACGKTPKAPGVAGVLADFVKSVESVYGPTIAAEELRQRIELVEDVP